MGTSIGVAIVMLALGIIIIAGKGDSLIAGFNTASKEEKDKYDAVKLRRLVGGLCAFIGVIIVPMHLLIGKVEANPDGGMSSGVLGFIFSGVFIVLSGVVVILANTWAKKK